MLSCASPDNHSNSSAENTRTTDQFMHKFDTDDTPIENMSENVTVPPQDPLMDHDLHWEMNYHEASIFLEVFLYTYTE